MSSTGRRMFSGIPTMPFSITRRPPPAPREVHFWCLFPHEVQDASLLNLYKTFLSSEEYAQVLQMDGKQIQKQALLARVLVRTTLARYAAGQINPKSLNFTKNKFGKPEVIWPSDRSYDEWKPPYLCFNLSHTSSLICCGVTTKSSLGIDVEEKGRRMSTNILAFAKRYFSSPEIAWLDAFTDPEEQQQKFIQLWTLKEAYVKALGRGISGAPLRDFAIHIKRCPVMHKNIGLHEDAGLIAIDQMIKLEVLRKNDAMTTGWQFLLFRPTNMHYASVCVEQAEKSLHEDEVRQMIYCGLKMQIWKTVPLIMDELMPVREAVIASTNICSF